MLCTSQLETSFGVCPIISQAQRMTTIFDEAQFHWFRKKFGFALPPVYLKLIGSQWFHSSNTIAVFCISSSSNFTASLKGCLANHRVINKLARSTVCISGRRLGQRICNFTKIFTCCVLLPQYLTRASRSVREQKLRTKVQKYQTCRVKGPCVLISLREDIFSWKWLVEYRKLFVE